MLASFAIGLLWLFPSLLSIIFALAPPVQRKLSWISEPLSGLCFPDLALAGFTALKISESTAFSSLAFSLSSLLLIYT